MDVVDLCDSDEDVAVVSTAGVAQMPSAPRPGKVKVEDNDTGSLREGIATTTKRAPEASPSDSNPGPESKIPRAQVDDDLRHIYETIDISPKSQSLLTEQDITDVSTLMDNASDLEKGTLPNVNRGTQKQLHKFCLWYESICADKDSTIDVKTRFGEDSLAEFENDMFAAATSDRSDGRLEADLERVCDEIAMTKRNRLQLAKIGITDIKALLARQSDLELFALSDLKQTIQKTLLKFCLWYEDFYRKNDEKTSWQPHFTDKSFAVFEQEPSVERDYRKVLERIHEGCNDGGVGKVSKEMIDHAATITTRYLTKQLKEQCSKKFNPYDVALKCVKALMHPTGSPPDVIHLVSGKTQSGKSSVKAVCAVVHRQLSCFLIVITKGIAERDELQNKLNNLLGGCRETMEAGLLVIADTGGQIAKATSAVLKIREELPHARFGVIVDECDAMYRTKNCAQIMEQRYAALMKLGPSFRMEVSATIYSAIQALEEQGKKVEMMEIMTTDDYCGVHQMKHFKDANNRDAFLNMKDIRPTEGVPYAKASKPGVRNTPLLFSDTHRTNLRCEGCKSGRGCPKHSDVLCKWWTLKRRSFIPYTSQAMIDMLDQELPYYHVISDDDDSTCESDASGRKIEEATGANQQVAMQATAGLIKEDPGEVSDIDMEPVGISSDAPPAGPNTTTKKGFLALIATDPRVYAEGNVIVQAACIQNHFRDKGKNFVAAVATGLGVTFRFPNCLKGRFIRRSLKTVSEIITMMDKVCGLEMPIVFFGYSRLCRCVSFRSSERVPTHMVLSRGPGYSLEDYIQALGRATFNGLSVLRGNGHANVMILTNPDDYQAAIKYYAFVEAINVHLAKNPGRGLVEALRSAAEKLPDCANFFRHTNRKIGRRKDLKVNDPGCEVFEEPVVLEDAVGKRERYWEDVRIQRVMKVFFEMAENDESFSQNTDELVESYNQHFSEEGDDSSSIRKVEMKKIMTALAKDVIFEKVPQDSKEKELAWTAKSLVVLKSMINENLEELDDRDDMY